MNKLSQPNHRNNADVKNTFQNAIKSPRANLIKSLDSNPVDEVESYGVPMVKKLETDYIDRLANNTLKLGRYLEEVQNQITKGKNLQNTDTVKAALRKIRKITQQNTKISEIHEMPNNEISLMVGEIEKQVDMAA